MDTKRIYEKIMLEYYFNKMKHVRNQWNSSSGEQFPGVASLIDIEGKEHRQYEFIMDRCNEIIYELLTTVIKELIKEYDIPVKYYDLRTSVTDSYYVGQEKHWIDHVDQHQEKRVLAFSRSDKNTDVLYVFKEFGIGKRIPPETLDGLMKAATLEKQCYISYVESDAFSEVINHNNNPMDPTRGTGIFSYKQFIEGFFGQEEYAQFRDYADQFSKKIKDYFGFALVRTLKPNAIHNFKKLLYDDLLAIDATKIGAAGIDDNQRRIIESHFLDDKNFEVLLGSGDFAQSFMTAEWLYTSLSDAGNIDLTAVAMGYFKAIEQLLFEFIKNHTHEMDGGSREIFVGKDKAYANTWGNAPLTDALVNDPEKAKELTLGSLTGFFGYHDTRRSRYYRRNQDLLVNGINAQTYDFIIDTLGGIVGLRNGYFHKDNLDDWNKIAEARNSALLSFYIVLGAFKVSESDKNRMGLIQVNGHDDYYKLCEYINRKAYSSVLLSIPIVYVDDISDPYAFGYFHQDDYIEYDNYGEAVYSGAYLQEFGKNGRVIKIDRLHLPKDIWEGVLVISESVPIKADPSGATKHIFCNGKFVADEE